MAVDREEKEKKLEQLLELEQQERLAADATVTAEPTHEVK